MKSSNQRKIRSPEKLEEDMRDILWAAAAGAGLYGITKAWTKFGRDAVAALPFATKKMKAAAAQRKLDKADEKEKDKETIAKGKAVGYDKDEDGIIIKPGDAEKYKKNAGKAPEGWITDKEGKLTRKEQSRVPEKTMTITESNELQAIMALDDAGIKAEINRKGEVSVKKKDLKKAQKALKKSFKKGGQPKLVGEEVDWDRFKLDEKWKEGTYTITDVKTGKVLGKFKSGAKAQKAADDIFQKGDYDAISVEVDEGVQESAYDKIKRIRSRLNESSDEHAETELKLYIQNDRDLYRQQIVPIIKNVQRRMKKGTYDHAKAPKLWMYLVDNGAKKYVKEFGGDDKRDFPKDLRLSIANEFANEYKAKIEIHSGEMI